MEQEIVISDYIRYTKQSGLQKDYMYNDVWKFVTTGEKTPKIKYIIDTLKYTKNWNFSNRSRPYTFMKNLSLEDVSKKPIQIDIFDIAGCGCFVD
jgi:hypothetical protein